MTNTLTMHADHVGVNTDRNWGTDHDTYKVTLTFERRRMTIDFHMGWGNRVDGRPTPPSIGDVLSSMASEASTAEQCATLDEYMNEFGYDADSITERQAHERTFNAINRTATKLRTLLGDDFYQVLIYEPADGGDWSSFEGDSIDLPDPT